MTIARRTIKKWQSSIKTKRKWDQESRRIVSPGPNIFEYVSTVRYTTTGAQTLWMRDSTCGATTKLDIYGQHARDRISFMGCINHEGGYPGGLRHLFHFMSIVFWKVFVFRISLDRLTLPHNQINRVDPPTLQLHARSWWLRTHPVQSDSDLCSDFNDMTANFYPPWHPTK